LGFKPRESHKWYYFHKSESKKQEAKGKNSQLPIDLIVYAKPTNVIIISMNLIAINGAITPPKP
jgi:hypothetical protein